MAGTGTPPGVFDSVCPIGPAPLDPDELAGNIAAWFGGASACI